jgi:hypothetical protein
MEGKRALDHDFDMLGSQGYDVEYVTRRDSTDDHHGDKEGNILLIEHA